MKCKLKATNIERQAAKCLTQAGESAVDNKEEN